MIKIKSGVIATSTSMWKFLFRLLKKPQIGWRSVCLQRSPRRVNPRHFVNVELLSNTDPLLGAAPALGWNFPDVPRVGSYGGFGRAGTSDALRFADLSQPRWGLRRQKFGR
jgi:hypothetical protein